MAKVKCKVCANEVSKVCKIKKSSVKLNRPRICKEYVYDESKLKIKKETPSIRFGYADLQEAKKRRKAELKALRASNKQKPGRGTARDLGLVVPDNELVMPRDTKHPLTGDLSRFTTTAKNDTDNNYKNKI